MNMESTIHGSELASKFKGCLLGALLGDCLGEPFEFGGINMFQVDHLFNNLKEGILPNKFQRRGYLPYTDDTAMTKVLAQSIIHNRSVDITDLALMFTRAYIADRSRGYGTFVQNVFRQLHEGPADILEPARKQFEGAGSYGNGAAMRVAPVALFYHSDTERMIEGARNSSLVTHAHRNGYNGAILQCFAIQAALFQNPNSTVEPTSFIQDLLIKMTEIEKDEETHDYCDQLVKMEQLIETSPHPPRSKVIKELGNEIIALRSVPTAIFAFLYAQKPIAEIKAETQFERTVKYAISLGGDTDTIACMAGGIVGAHLGVNAIPRHLISVCEDNKLVGQLADKLFKKSSLQGTECFLCCK